MSGETYNALVNPMLTDMYQISMSYAYWKNGTQDQQAVFDLFFRKNPFKGEYTVCAGIGECINFINSFRFTDSDIEYLKSIMPGRDPLFFVWLKTLDNSKIKLYAVEEGTVVFPKEPMLRIEGPLAVCQLLETTLLNCVNFPSLIATNARRMRIAAGPKKSLLEFGLRRAQGPDGGLAASKYSYLGGFDGTSNVLAGKLFGIDVKGTHAHSFVMSYTSLSELSVTTISSVEDPSVSVEFVSIVLQYREELGYQDTNDGELAAFIAYSQAFPSSSLCLIDTYDTLASGLRNFIIVALALHDLGYHAIGVRLDSGDLAHLSKEVRKTWKTMDAKFENAVFTKCLIFASNDINEDVLLKLEEIGHEIDTFGIGTNLVTCQKQPALGCVYKLVEIDGKPRIKLSQDIVKLLIPGRKNLYRLIGTASDALCDVMTTFDEPKPQVGEKLLVRDPFNPSKRTYVTAKEVRDLLVLAFDGSRTDDKILRTCTLADARRKCERQLAETHPDHLRPSNPTKYSLYASCHLYDFMQEIWEREAPIPELL